MKQLAAGIVMGVTLVLGLGVVLWTGFVDIRWPWESLPEFAEVDVDVELPTEARIVGVEPIALDCRARVYAEIPVHGERRHQLFGATYRTDTVDLVAAGDIDTCVEGSAAQVTHYLDGTTEVVIPGESIVFVRPRVDTVATMDSVEVSRGLVGRVTDVFPWVDDDLGLTPAAYAYAQNVIGSSACTRTAYELTEQLLIDAYRQQFVDQGLDPDDLTVTIEGEPLFSDPEDIDLGEVELTVSNGETSCVPSDDLGGESESSQR